jgi:hypothetical protein
METYSIGIIIQSTDTLSKIRAIAVALRNAIDIYQDGDYYRCSLKSNPDTEVKLFLGIAKECSSQLRNIAGSLAVAEDNNFLPSLGFLWFGENYTLDEMVNKMMQHIRESYYQVITSDQNLDNLDDIRRFIKG